MAIQKSESIWHNGKLIPWDDATIHVMSHVIHYGSSVFEGIRCYAPPSGPAIFRAHEHIQRLLDSAKVYRIDVDLHPRRTGEGDARNRGQQWRVAVLRAAHRSSWLWRGGSESLQLADRGLHH